MKIVVLKGSPRTSGNSNWLADRFVDEAVRAGHECFVFDCAKQQINGCLGCGACGMKRPCVQQDDFVRLREPLIEADAILFATPIYYFGMSGQLKNVIDRFYAVHGCMGRKKTLLFATMGNPDARVADPAVAMYEKMVAYLGWEDCGRIIAAGVWAPGDVQQGAFGEQAAALARSL